MAGSAEMQNSEMTKPALASGLCNNTCAGEARKPFGEVYMTNIEQISGKGQALGSVVDELRASFERVANLYPINRDAGISDTDQGRAILRDIGLQQYALSILPRFRAAALVDQVCCLFGWRLHGMGSLDELDVGDDFIDRAAALEWLHPASDDHEVRLELGDDPVVLVRRHGADDWVEVKRGAWGLPDVLGDWAAELEVRQ